MNAMLRREALGPLVAGLIVLAGCGGGSAKVSVTFSLLSVAPSISNDLTGGDPVTINGSGFNAAVVTRVTFGGSVAFNITPIDDASFRVTTPPAPGGVPGTIIVEVETQNAGVRQLFNAYTYIDAAQPPLPQTITPTVYTPTGAETFTIQGTNLGPAGGTQTVRFNGVGVVTASVSQDGQFLTGRAPVSSGLPPVGPITVDVEPVGGAPVSVPTQVSYNLPVPAGLPVANQTGGNASQPVRLTDGAAILCTSGTDNIWGNGNDSILIVQGPPFTVTSILANGNLSAANSIPAVLDADTFCVYSIGPDGFVATIDDRILHISAARSGAPVVTPVLFATSFLNSAPLAAIGPNRIATTAAGPDGTRGTGDDQIVVVTFTGTLASVVLQPNSGAMDFTGGARAWSIPFSPDGENVYALSVGVDGAAATADDLLVRTKASQIPAGAFSVGAPFLVGPPSPLGGGLLVAPAGSGGAPGAPNDILAVFVDNGSSITRTVHGLGTRVQVAALRPFVPLGVGSIALTVAGPDTLLNSGDEQVRIFTDPLAGVATNLTLPGTHLLAGLGSGAVAVWPAGLNGRLIDSQALSATPFGPNISWGLGFGPLADTSRVFAIDPGSDAITLTGDENLVVFQSLTVLSGASAALLPLATGATFPLTTANPFVPIGPNWGIVQSPGANGTFNNGDDQLVIGFY